MAFKTDNHALDTSLFGRKRKKHNAETAYLGESYKKGLERVGKVRADAWARADKRESRHSESD